jgi:predicted esterase
MYKNLRELIEKEIVQHEGDASRIFIGGFGQGGSMALATYLMMENDVQLGGVICCSGIQCYNLDWSKVSVKKKKKTPVLLTHGKHDPVTGCALATMSYKNMKKKGLDHLEIHIDELEH